MPPSPHFPSPELHSCLPFLTFSYLYLMSLSPHSFLPLIFSFLLLLILFHQYFTYIPPFLTLFHQYLFPLYIIFHQYLSHTPSFPHILSPLPLSQSSCSLLSFMVLSLFILFNSPTSLTSILPFIKHQ